MKLKDWLFLILVVALFGVSMFFPKAKDQSNDWQECYSIGFILSDRVNMYHVTEEKPNQSLKYYNKSIKIRFDKQYYYIKIVNWADEVKEMSGLRESANILVNYK